MYFRKCVCICLQWRPSTQGILNWSHSRLEWSSHAKLFPEQTYNVLGPFEVETQGAQSKPSRVSFEGTDMKSGAKLITPSHSKPCHRQRMKFKREKMVKIMCYNMPWPGGHQPWYISYCVLPTCQGRHHCNLDSEIQSCEMHCMQILQQRKTRDMQGNVLTWFTYRLQHMQDLQRINRRVVQKIVFCPSSSCMNGHTSTYSTFTGIWLFCSREYL